MDTIQSRLKLYSLIETHLRKAAKDVRPVAQKQLLSVPDIYKAAGGKVREVYNVLRTFQNKDVLIDFSSEGTPFNHRTFTWKDDVPTPEFRVLNRRTKAEREAEKVISDPIPVIGAPLTKPVDLFTAMGSAHSLNKPVGQETGFVPGQPVPPMAQEDLMHFGLQMVRKGFDVKFSHNEQLKLSLTITEK